MWSKIRKEQQKKLEDWQKRQEKRVKQGKLRDPERTRPDIVHLKFKVEPSTMPSFRPAVAVMVLKVEPGRYRPIVARLNSGLPGVFVSSS